MSVLPGVHRVELPLPFSLGSINVYFVETRSGHLLIDCGMDTPECFDALDRARADLGIGWSGVTNVVLTHMHPDHMGLAPRVLALSGAKLAMHPRDMELLATLAGDSAKPDWGHLAMLRAGVPEDLIGRVERAFVNVRRSFRELQPDVLLRGGERISASHGDLEIIWTPGHSPGHICLYQTTSRALFAGDHMLERISPNIGWLPEADPLHDYLQSLKSLAGFEIDLILPSHGEPFSGHRDWIARALEHHEERCRTVLSLLGENALTAHELTLKMWDRELSSFDYRFAVFEVLAHLEYLYNREEVGTFRDGAGLRWTSCNRRL